MARRGHSPEQIVQKLREVEAALATGSTVPQAVRQIGVSEQTYYRWRNAYGKMEKDQLRLLKTLEVKNRRLKKIVADQALDLQIVKEALRENPESDSTAAGRRSRAEATGRLRATRLPDAESAADDATICRETTRRCRTTRRRYAAAG